MATITITDFRGSPLSLVKVQIDADNAYEIYIPKQLADLITQANSGGIVNRQNSDRPITGA